MMIKANKRSDSLASADAVQVEGLELSKRLAVICLIVCLLISACLMAKQLIFCRTASADATAYYLPLARMVAQQGVFDAQHPMIPPLYPVLTGVLSKFFNGIAVDPQEIAGRLISSISLLGVVCCVFGIGALVWSRRVGVIAAALSCANPYMIRTSANVGPDMLYALLLAMCVWLMLLSLREGVLFSGLCACACAALAAVTRSEGIFLVPLAVIVVLIGSFKSLKPRLRWLIVPHAVLLAIIIVGLWLPRINYMNSQTGYPLLDVRMAKYIPDFELDMSLRRHPGQIARIDIRQGSENGRKFLPAVNEAIESIVMVNGPLTLTCILGLFILGTYLPSRSATQLIIASVVLVEIALILTVKANSRYFTSVAALVQLWGALGMVALAEMLRRQLSDKSFICRISASLPRQMTVLCVITAGLSLWSVLATNTGSRSAELRTLGEIAGEKFGSGRVFLAGSPETAYYASGLTVTVIEGQKCKPFTPQSLAELCSEYSVDFIVIRTKENWAPWIIEKAADGSLPDGSITAFADDTARGEPLTSYMINTHVLFDGISSR